MHLVCCAVYHSFLGSDLGKLAKPSYQMGLEGALGIRNQSSPVLRLSLYNQQMTSRSNSWALQRLSCKGQPLKDDTAQWFESRSVHLPSWCDNSVRGYRHMEC